MTVLSRAWGQEPVACRWGRSVRRVETRSGISADLFTRVHRHTIVSRSAMPALRACCSPAGRTRGLVTGFRAFVTGELRPGIASRVGAMMRHFLPYARCRKTARADAVRLVAAVLLWGRALSPQRVGLLFRLARASISNALRAGWNHEPSIGIDRNRAAGGRSRAVQGYRDRNSPGGAQA